MKTERWMQRGVACLLGLLICHLTGSAFARPRPPGPPYPEMGVLSSFNFDNTSLFTNASSFLVHDAALVESWSGYALGMEGNAPKLFVIPAVDEKGKTNLTTAVGTIRFWFKPAWSSSTLGGNGPGAAARLFEVGAWTEKQSVGWWSLQFSPGGDAISFLAQSKGECVDILQTAIQWPEGEWHQVAFSYSPQGSWLFLDGQLAAQGQALALVPLERTRGALGFALGSDAQGMNLAQGQFDAVTTFKAVQSVDLLAWNFSCLAGTAALGPITPEEDAARMQQLLALRAARLGTADTTMMTLDSVPTPPPGGGGGGTNGSPSTNIWIWASGFNHGTNLCFHSIGYVVTNLTTNVYLTITNTIATNTYDLYVSTNLNSVSLWGGATQGIAWSFVTNLSAGTTSVTLSNVTDFISFYAVALHKDSDGDGLSDGDELFLYKTDPNNADTDGDGLNDKWEVDSGMNPLLNESAQSGTRLNFVYDAVGRLKQVTGKVPTTITYDKEGNVNSVTR